MLTEEARRQVDDNLNMARKAIENCLFIEDFCRSHNMGEKTCELLKKERLTARNLLFKAGKISTEVKRVSASREADDPWYVVKERLSQKWQVKINAWNKEDRESYLSELLEEGRKQVENSQISPTGLWYLSRNWLVRFSDGWYYYCKYKLDC